MNKSTSNFLWFAIGMIVAGQLDVATNAFKSALAHDSHYALSTEMKTWFDSLKSGQGPCCSDADGSVLQDVDWESNGTGYRVRIDGKWIDVPPNAVIDKPNRYGPTMVWPLRTGGTGWNYDTGVMDDPVITIRCFMPGSMG